MPGTFALEPAHGKGDSGSSHALVFTLQISVRVCCASLEMREVHVFQQRSGDEPNTWHQTLRGGRREVRLPASPSARGPSHRAPPRFAVKYNHSLLLALPLPTLPLPKQLKIKPR